MRLILFALALALAGCSTPQATTVNVTTSTWCQIAKKVTYDIDDTPETISQVRAHNGRVDTCKKAQAKVS